MERGHHRSYLMSRCLFRRSDLAIGGTLCRLGLLPFGKVSKTTASEGRNAYDDAPLFPEEAMQTVHAR